jgi:hypothetical protein
MTRGDATISKRDIREIALKFVEKRAGRELRDPLLFEAFENSEPSTK